MFFAKVVVSIFSISNHLYFKMSIHGNQEHAASLYSGNYLLKRLRSWLLRCKKIRQQSVGFPTEQAQRGWHFMVIIMSFVKKNCSMRSA